MAANIHTNDAGIQTKDPRSRCGHGLYWRLIPAALVTLAGVAMIFVPVATLCSETEDGVETCTSSTLGNDEGWGPLLVFLLPALIAGLVAVVVNRRWAAVVSATVVSLFMLVGLASVGVFLFPAVIAAWLLVWQSSR